MKEEIKITPNGIKQAIDDLLNENESLNKKVEEFGHKIYKLKKENKKYKEVIDKIDKYISNKKAIINTDVIRIFDLFEIDEQGYMNELKDILKEVSE